MAIRNGVANSRMGLSQAVSPWPEVNQTIISLSRYHLDKVSSTVRNSATERRMLK